jgi:hypothetical protein
MVSSVKRLALDIGDTSEGKVVTGQGKNHKPSVESLAGANLSS